MTSRTASSSSPPSSLPDPGHIDAGLLAALPAEAPQRLAELAQRLQDPLAPISVSDPAEIWRAHILDSLSPLSPGSLLAGTFKPAASVIDLGAGAGLPGLALAICLPATSFTLIDATKRKCDFMEELVHGMGIENAQVVCGRSEELSSKGEAGSLRESADLVTVRAVARLATIAELATPLLREGGQMIAWKGAPDPAEQAEFEAALPLLGLGDPRVEVARPYPESTNRHLHFVTKMAPTPTQLPRNPGIAKKRPYGRA